MVQDPSTENNIALNQTIAEYTRYFTPAARSNWIKETEHLNQDKDGDKLRKLARAMSDEKSTSAPMFIEHNVNLLSGKHASDLFINNFQKVNDDEDTRKEDREAQKQFRDMNPEDDVMTTPLTSQEIEEAIKLLKN